MRLNFRFQSSLLLIIALLLSSCGDNDKVLNYQIENKLTSPINVRFIGENYAAKSVNITIKSNEIKDVIVGVTGFDGAYGLYSYDSAFIELNNIKYTYTKKDTEGLLSYLSYMDMGSSKTNGKNLSIRKLIVDEDFIPNSNK